MKKIFTLIAFAFIVMAVSGCGVSKQITNDPYTGEGYAEAMDRNIAREKAYANAVADITRKYDVTVTEDAQQRYTSDERKKGKATESMSFASVVKTHSNARMGNVVVTKEKTRETRKGWTSKITVAIEPDNIE